ncbi:hypothetical protein M2171_003891 [Bradyrhizobium japonicum USDA 38]|jgi:hypothetical protein|nr:hypothetical protein [Bradyrhizobium japonicum]MCS3894758.1 hypothetical protein [Bradyrhizobium japonicum USDA 38]MCS3541432.1 hypothetical protein [Bradyrhizobium japonicum]MCS3947273.1 hypothetical protein [Bradyrhizobium japonicum]MCS3962978.1 hypothetical protein [Bradyrhizobium japonicum]
MSGEANCIVCSQARTVVAVFPIARGYALKVYECSCCHSTLHLVTRTTKAALIRQHCETLLPVEKPPSATGPRVQQRFAH